MHWLDILIFFIYMVIMLGIGFFFLRQNKSDDDYYVGGRSMGSMHVGLSVVATDVGGGFSIGLGGLGFTMGISGSWMLFTGLIGAWLSAVVLIPKVSKMSKLEGLYTFPQIFGLFYNKKVALLAGIISAIGYLGFTSSQMLAGAKLASATFVNLDLMTALFVMGVIAVVYTVMGGLKAVIYTDTVQWIILMAGLIFIGIPMGYHAIGGYDAIVQTLPPEFLRWDNLTWQMLVNWAVTIIPIWFVGMTLYQRIYACKGPKEAQKAWFIAGLFEWPIMAIMGVVLGLFARVAAEQGMFDAVGYAGAGTMDEEIGLPLLLRDILPVGLLGLMMSAYFSAILSTADSCLMAASGNIVTDILGVKSTSEATSKSTLRMSQLITLGVGVAALILASTMENVLELMLYSYAFLVSGLLVPLVAALFGAKVSSTAAFWSMLVGGATTVGLSIAPIDLPLQLDPNVFGISASAAIFVILNSVTTKKTYAHDKL
ncbi:MAG: sodium:solute symporter family protein [Imperialibacter sp.]|uniref:sodium:solute symporter family protein n=1 Tax=Imperialibacter sp. TaxID=2038411 RepID=UPI0032EE9190